jgi:hypothetical protein
MEGRLASGIWVSAYLARLRLAGIPAYLVARGDETAGTVLVKLALLDGRAKLFERQYDLAKDVRVWGLMAEGPEAEVDSVIARARGRDRDLWVIEVEDRQGRSLLDEDGLA